VNVLEKQVGVTWPSGEQKTPLTVPAKMKEGTTGSMTRQETDAKPRPVLAETHVAPASSLSKVPLACMTAKTRDGSVDVAANAVAKPKGSPFMGSQVTPPSRLRSAMGMKAIGGSGGQMGLQGSVLRPETKTRLGARGSTARAETCRRYPGTESSSVQVS